MMFLKLQRNMAFIELSVKVLTKLTPDRWKEENFLLLTQCTTIVHSHHSLFSLDKSTELSVLFIIPIMNYADDAIWFLCLQVAAWLYL